MIFLHIAGFMNSNQQEKIQRLDLYCLIQIVSTDGKLEAIRGFYVLADGCLKVCIEIQNKHIDLII